MVARRAGNRGWAKWVSRRQRYRLPVMEGISHRDGRHTTGNTVNGNVTAMSGDGCRPSSREHSVTYRNADTMLYT